MLMTKHGKFMQMPCDALEQQQLVSASACEGAANKTEEKHILVVKRFPFHHDGTLTSQRQANSKVDRQEQIETHHASSKREHAAFKSTVDALCQGFRKKQNSEAKKEGTMHRQTVGQSGLLHVMRR